ncbi:SERTA domain-containing protein 2b [Austrofundulus limnaeus]|uniref:SERTA domain-containing protein 2 n=1 Tax=Austrofundulus limnaeus TaxID=52670 RepID=A0A2I4AYD3_AUSLI|nr:PREDICTED: SERTA domain-containing protein 2 [Austrofundulus limnaeus]XP_013860491.1 PREDICTED: SERTA domain-containing protein 2 [Austrofundulus limnaeus]
MLGKGAKRKLDEDEEGLEGKTLEAPAAGGAGPEGLSKVSYTLQRQTIFNISLMKLYSQRPLSELRLERRVLINNMLRRIQDELKQEGSLRPLLLPPSPPPDDPMDEGFREAPPSFGVLSAGEPQPSSLLMQGIPPPPSPHPVVPPGCQASHRLEACLTPASLLEEDGSPSPPTPPMSPSPGSHVCPGVPVPGGPALNLRDMELGVSMDRARTAAANSTTTTTSPAPTQPPPSVPRPSGSFRDCRTVAAKTEAAAAFVVESRSADLRQTDPPPPHSPASLEDICPAALSPPSSSSPSGFLSDLALDDVLFADIDTSMYDFDPCTTGGSVGVTAGGGLTKLPPVMNADDLLKSLASPYGGSAPQVSVSQPFKIDLTELDHIMEVLVGS